MRSWDASQNLDVPEKRLATCCARCFLNASMHLAPPKVPHGQLSGFQPS
jgi:hypothetical protein